MGWFYVVFMACFMPWLWYVLCRVYGMFCGLNWEDIVVGEKGLFLGWFRVKMACTGAAKELSGTLLRRSHTIASLGFGIAALRYAIAWVLAQLCSPYTPSNLQL